VSTSSTVSAVIKPGDVTLTIEGFRVRSLNYWLSGLSRGARMTIAEAAKRERRLAATVCRLYAGEVALPVVVTLTRIAPRRLDGDNCAGGLKHWRDGIADWLGIDDADPRVSWRYEQERGEYALRIRVQYATP
jgi:hypothetical protein